MTPAHPGKVYFIGAGPGDPELLTLKGRRLIDAADLILYTGSLVNPKLFANVRKGVPVLDSSPLDLGEILEKMLPVLRDGGLVARVHTGDPTIYSAIAEQIARLRSEGIDWEIVPGVGSVGASAAVLGAELTIPEITQTLILTRVEGRTPVPERENLRTLAAHQATMAFFLSAGQVADLVSELTAGGYPPETPVGVVYRATWEDQTVVRGTLADIAQKMSAAGISKHAMILVGAALGDIGELGQHRSKLYDESFTHGYRRART
jgi:precorrin-4/cobalt-precorrin-4 C11-methyltransferase